jgi:LuxR family maltose regulon positive regulatory protein
VADALHGSLVAACRHAEEALSITGSPGSGAAAHAGAAMASGLLAGDPFCRTLAEATEAELEHSRDQTRSAVRRLETAAAGAARENPWLADRLRVEAATMSLTAGDPEHALDVLESVQLPDRPEPRVTAAVVLVEQGLPGDTDTWPAHDQTAPLGSQVGVLLVEAAQAAQHCATGEARTALTKALRLAAPERLRRPFRESGTHVERLLSDDAGIVAGHEWLQPGRVQAASSHADDSSVEWIVVDPLTHKELEVLGHLAELLTTDEIAQKMFISVNTVRTHIRNILHKLGVSRRNAAIRRARELGLLDL